MISGLTQHYTVVHKKSTLYYLQANGLAESTSKTLQNILRKIVNENITYWDTKLSSVLWAYRTSFKTSVQATPFLLAYGIEAVMAMEFQIPSLRVQVKERMTEEASERIRESAIGKTQVHNLAVLELYQQRRKAFVDRHRGRNEKMIGEGKAVLVFQTRMGKMPGKLRF